MILTPELLHQLAGPIIQNLQTLNSFPVNPTLTKYINDEIDLLTSVSN